MKATELLKERIDHMNRYKTEKAKKTKKIIITIVVFFIIGIAINIIGIDSLNQKLKFIEAGNKFCKEKGLEKMTDWRRYTDRNRFADFKIQCDSEKIFSVYSSEWNSCEDWNKWGDCESYKKVIELEEIKA